MVSLCGRSPYRRAVPYVEQQNRRDAFRVLKGSEDGSLCSNLRYTGVGGLFDPHSGVGLEMS